MADSDKVTILLADEDALRRDGLAAVLQGTARFEVIALAPDGAASMAWHSLHQASASRYPADVLPAPLALCSRMKNSAAIATMAASTTRIQTVREMFITPGPAGRDFRSWRR